MFASLAAAPWGFWVGHRIHVLIGPLSVAIVGATARVAVVVSIHSFPAMQVIWTGVVALIGATIWRPSDDHQAILDGAVAWAAKSNSLEVMPLLSRAARADAVAYRATALIWTSANNHVESANWLLDNGADVSKRVTFVGPSHGEGVIALHLATYNDHAEMVELIFARGGDPFIRDALYDITAAGYAEHANVCRALIALTTPR